MANNAADEEAATPIEVGAVVYDHSGDELGVVTGMTAEGFEVSIRMEIESVDDQGRATVTDDDFGEKIGESDAETLEEPEEEKPGKDFGEGYIMWRCEECGEMGKLEEGLPNECPNCGSEEVIKWRED